MAFASWLRLSKFSFASVRKAAVPRQPLRSRLTVEYLEDRMLLSAAGSDNQLSGVNNATNNFNLAAAGITLPTTSQQDNPQAISQFVNDFGVAMTDADADILGQGSRTAQFRSFGVNSQGQGNVAQINQQMIITDAFGFGSGASPNAPWMPAAYNLGLANHQFGYSSQSDMGFQSTPPWFHSDAESTPRKQPLDEVEMAKETKELALTQPSVDEHEQERQSRRDEDASDKKEERNLPIEELAFEKQSATDKAAPSLTRGDPATEDALFNNSLQTLTVAAVAAGLPMVEAPAQGGNVAVEMGAAE